MREQDVYIIDTPALKSTLRHGTELTVTVVAWLVWFYLLMPLITFLMWIVGLRLFFVKQFMLDSMTGLASVFLYYLATMAIIGLVLTLWNVYNREIHGGPDRRTHANPVDEEELSKFFDIPVIDIKSSKSARHISVSFTDDRISLSPN